MIEVYLRPESVSQALEMASEHSGKAVWFAGGSKINAAQIKSDKTVAISLGGLGLNSLEFNASSLRIGAMCTIQRLIDHSDIPGALKQAAGFIYSRHIRNQATLGGEIAARQEESLILSTLIAMNATVELADGQELTVEQYRHAAQPKLITHINLPDTGLICANRNITRSSAGLSVLTAAVSLSKTGEKRVVLDGLSALDDLTTNPVRALDIEQSQLDGEALEKAVSEWVEPCEDIRGSVAYKRYIAGVVVADLMAECQQLAGE